MANPNYEYDISVVIPVYNVEEYLIECLDSVYNQTKDKIQVIIIDDGSPDNSGQMADEYCATHENFECIHIENGGLGHARNYALDYVKGKYVAYMDSDDVVPPDMYEVMFRAAERNQSDMTCCNAMRFNSSGFMDSLLHSNAMKPIHKEVNHITSDFSLLYDTTAWNKLIRVDFMKKHGFKFPEKILYEDIPTTIPMHFLANKVAVVKTTAYYWRVRDGVTTSITQEISNLRNLYDRITVMTMNNKFLKEHNASDELYRRKLIKDLESDLIIFVNNCKMLPDDVAKEVFSCINKYIKEYINEDILSSIALIYRQKYEHVMKNDLEGLRNLLQNQNNYYNAQVTERNGRFYMEPADDLFTVPQRDVTNMILKTNPRNYINKFTIKANTATIDGHVYIPRVNIPTSEEQKIEAYILNDLTGDTLPINFEYIENLELTRTRGFIFDDYSQKTTEYNYDGTGFSLFINPEQMEIPDEFLGSNHILIKYENRVKSGEVLLGGGAKGTKDKLNNSRIISGEKMFCFKSNNCGEIVIDIQKLDTVIEEVSFKNKQIHLSLLNPVPEVYIGNEEMQFSATISPEGCYSFDISELQPEYTYFFSYKDAAGEIHQLYNSNKKTKIKRTFKGVILISYIKDYKPQLIISPYLGVVSGVVEREDAPNILDVSVGAYGKESTMEKVEKAVLCYDDNVTGKLHQLASVKVTDEEKEPGKFKIAFSLDFNKEKLTKDMHECVVRLKLKIVFANKKDVLIPLYAKKAMSVRHQQDTLKVKFSNKNKNEMAFTAWQVWREEEATPYRRKALLNQEYPKYTKLPINKRRIMFESMWGKKYSCNPQAIYEYIQENYPEYECVWALNDPRYPIKGDAIRVRRMSLEYFYYLATSKYLVNNVNFPDEYKKRRGQIEVQTMHGTPLKTFGLEIPGEFESKESRKRFIKRNARWNYLVVQGEFTAKKSYDCFGVRVKKLRTGYPRTDMLYNATEKQIISLKKSLKIPLDKKVVLYAPTWRVRNEFDMQLDIERFRETLGDEYVLLVRVHHFAASGYTIPADNKVIFDVNNYFSIENLYIISDMLITDYSSALFDYAITNKPMIFYLYDIQEYSENLRGTYFDIEKEAPGPLAYNNDQLISVIQNVDEEMKKCEERRHAFYDKYVNYECGDSSRQVVEKMLRFRNRRSYVKIREEIFRQREAAAAKKAKKNKKKAAEANKEKSKAVIIEN